MPLQMVGYEGSVVFSVSLELRTLHQQGVILFHSLVSGGHCQGRVKFLMIFLLIYAYLCGCSELEDSCDQNES